MNTDWDGELLLHHGISPYSSLDTPYELSVGRAPTNPYAITQPTAPKKEQPTTSQPEPFRAKYYRPMTIGGIERFTPQIKGEWNHRDVCCFIMFVIIVFCALYIVQLRTKVQMMKMLMKMRVKEHASAQ